MRSKKQEFPKFNMDQAQAEPKIGRQPSQSWEENDEDVDWTDFVDISDSIRGKLEASTTVDRNEPATATDAESTKQTIEFIITKILKDEPSKEFEHLVNIATAFGDRLDLPLKEYFDEKEAPEDEVFQHTLLTLACVHGKTKCAKKLLAMDAKADVLNLQGFSPLILASVKGKNIEIIEALLEKGASWKQKLRIDADREMSAADLLYLEQGIGNAIPDETSVHTDEKSDESAVSAWRLLRYISLKEREELRADGELASDFMDYDPSFDLLEVYRQDLAAAQEISNEMHQYLLSGDFASYSLPHKLDLLREHQDHITGIYRNIFDPAVDNPSIDLKKFKRFVEYSANKEQYEIMAARYINVWNRIRRFGVVWSDQFKVFSVQADQADQLAKANVAEKCRQYGISVKEFKQPFRINGQSIIDVMPDCVVVQQRLNDFAKMFVTHSSTPDVFPDLEEGLYQGKVKSFTRVWEKMGAMKVKKPDSDNEDIWDLSRCLLTYKTLEDIGNAIAALCAMGSVEIVSVWNRFNDDKKRWQDVMIHVMFPAQSPSDFVLVSEMQFALYDYVVERRHRGGHHAYSEFRLIAEVCASRKLYPQVHLEALWEIDVNLISEVSVHDIPGYDRMSEDEKQALESLTQDEIRELLV